MRSGLVAVAANGDTNALRISGIASVMSDSVTTIAVSFEDAHGAPATHPAASRVVFRPEVGVLRVQLPPSVTSWAFTDKAFATGLVSDAYVVRCQDGSIALDLHLREPASVQAAYGDTTAPLTLTLCRGGLPMPARAAHGGTILLTPAPGDHADTLVIEGYARPFEAHLEIHLTGAAPRDTFTGTADYAETWGEFRFRLARGTQGNADTLRVGEPNMETEEWLGIRLPLGRR